MWAYSYDGAADPGEPGGISAIYKDLIADEERLSRIYDDVMAAYKHNARILLLTTWKAHLDSFRSRFEAAGLKPVVFTGAMKAKDRQAAVDPLANTDDAQPLLVLGTGSYIGEGFDCPKLDTLFLAASISFKAGWSNMPAVLLDHIRAKRSRPFTTTMTSPRRYWQHR